MAAHYMYMHEFHQRAQVFSGQKAVVARHKIEVGMRVTGAAGAAGAAGADGASGAAGAVGAAGAACAGCRPNKRLTFNLNKHGSTSRADIAQTVSLVG